MQMLLQAARRTWLDQLGRVNGPQERARESTERMLSHKKGRRYGEGHPKAAQISTDLLPLVSASRLEEARCLPGLRPTRNAGHLFMRACVPLALPQRCREVGNGLSGDEATEISAATLLLTVVRLCRWEERRSAISSPMEGRHPQRAGDMRIVGREDGHPREGGRWYLYASIFGAGSVTSAYRP
jgi:hypothetical protein